MKAILVAGLTCCLVVTGASGAAAAQSPTPAPAAPLPPPDAFQQAMTARAVADFARRQKDVQAMIVAARMLQEVPVKDAPGTAAGSDAGFSPAGLYDEARGLAHGDAATLEQIRIAQSTGTRGVFDSVFGKGLLRLVQNVAGGGRYSFDVRALGGQILRIGAIGDIGTAMLLRLVDAAGHVACSDDNNDYAPVCALTPRANAKYHVELVNRSRAPSRTVILSN